LNKKTKLKDDSFKQNMLSRPVKSEDFLPGCSIPQNESLGLIRVKAKLTGNPIEPEMK
jgi:hypothetical protein